MDHSLYAFAQTALYLFIIYIFYGIKFGCESISNYFSIIFLLNLDVTYQTLLLFYQF